MSYVYLPSTASRPRQFVYVAQVTFDLRPHLTLPATRAPSMGGSCSSDKGSASVDLYALDPRVGELFGAIL